MREYKAGVRLRILCSTCNKVHLPQRSPTNVEREECPF
jgi:hypothetical protein